MQRGYVFLKESTLLSTENDTSKKVRNSLGEFHGYFAEISFGEILYFVHLYWLQRAGLISQVLVTGKLL